ncbi:hypothetical protein C7212DRAFT_180429, partial [Tuber magnatum]
KELNFHDRVWIFKAITLDSSPLAIASHFGCTRQTVYRTIKQAYELNHLVSMPRTGHPKCLNPQIILYLLHLIWSFPNIYFHKLIKDSGAKVYIRTIGHPLRPNARHKWRCCE